MGGLWSFGFLVLVAIGILIAWIIRQGRSGAGPRPWTPAGRDSALEILRERYARGEIGPEEFERKKKDLTG